MKYWFCTINDCVQLNYTFTSLCYWKISRFIGREPSLWFPLCGDGTPGRCLISRDFPHWTPCITRTACRKFNKEQKIEVLGSIGVHFLTYNFGRPIELWMLLLLLLKYTTPWEQRFLSGVEIVYCSILLLDQVREITTRKTCMVTHVFINVHFLSCQKSNCLLISHGDYKVSSSGVSTTPRWRPRVGLQCITWV